MLRNSGCTLAQIQYDDDSGAHLTDGLHRLFLTQRMQILAAEFDYE
jgi:hypothetical protein